MEVMISICRDGKRQLEPLCFLGWLPVGENGVVLAGGLTEIQRMVETGVIAPPEGYIKPSKRVTDIIEGNDDSK